MEREQLTGAGGRSDERVAAVGWVSSACEGAPRAPHRRVATVPTVTHLSGLPGRGRWPRGRGRRALEACHRASRHVRLPARAGAVVTHTCIITWPLDPPIEDEPVEQTGTRPRLS